MVLSFYDYYQYCRKDDLNDVIWIIKGKLKAKKDYRFFSGKKNKPRKEEINSPKKNPIGIKIYHSHSFFLSGNSGLSITSIVGVS